MALLDVPPIFRSIARLYEPELKPFSQMLAERQIWLMEADRLLRASACVAPDSIAHEEIAGRMADMVHEFQQLREMIGRSKHVP